MNREKVVNVVRWIASGFGNLFIILLSTASVLICRSISWMFETWPYLSMDELMYQLRAPIDGTSRGMIRDYLIFCVPVAAAALLVSAFLLFFFRKRKKIYLTVVIVELLASVALLCGFAYMTWNRLDIGSYAENNGTYSEFIDMYYVDPSETQLTFPEEKRNLIYIFLESMEATYSDQENGGAFEDNYIPELTSLAQQNEDFSGDSSQLNGAISLTGSGWTMGALFTQTSGLPLSIPIDGNSMDTQECFFPAMVNLGDILEEQGYTQTFMIGSDAAFGGRDLYFSEHGNYDIEDYYYFQNLGKFPEDYWVWWGFEDQKLFEYAKEKLTELASQSEPFNFTMLTVDTHFEDGYECELCSQLYGDNSYANVMACSSRQVSEFVSWIQEQDFYENTTIVISGDHLTMDSDFCAEVDDSYERSVYTAYINSAVQPEDPDWERLYSTLDSMPTTLASLGVKIEGNRLGLGTNLFSDEMTLLERYGIDKTNSELGKRSSLMDTLTSDIDLNSEELLIREGKNPKAVVETAPYDYTTGMLVLTADSFENIDDITGVTAAVWTQEDQSDLQWMQAEQQEDGSYLLEIPVVSFGYQTGEYRIDVYAADSSGEQYCVGSTVGLVE